ncbi:MAG: PorV/PorQ family protein, partial [Fidelibacterota bacterium]
LFLSADAYGQDTEVLAKVGTFGAQFLKIQVGARGMSLGDAYTIIGDDASTIFWNPAGLTGVRNTSLFFSHTEWLAGIRYEAGAVARHFDGIGTFGISFSYLTSGEIEETTVDLQEGTGRKFSTVDLMVGASFARMLTDKFGIGGNLKLVKEDLGVGLEEDYSDAVWGVDIGILYDTGFRTIKIGMSIRNFGPEMQPAGTYIDYDQGKLIYEPGTTVPQKNKFRQYRMPLNFRFGVAVNPIDNDMGKLNLSIVGEHPPDNVERVNMGAEYWFQNMLALRGGYSFGHDTKGISFGAGIKFSSVNVDYAYTDFGVLNFVHTASLLFNL